MGVWWQGVPPCRVSHAVEHVVDRIDVVCLSGKGATVDRARVVCLRGRGVARFLALSVDLSDVGVVGLFHAVILQGQGADARGCVTVCQLVGGGGHSVSYTNT